MSELIKKMQSNPKIKLFRNLFDNEKIDISNDPFALFDWFEAVPSTRDHALLNFLLILEGHEPIKYNKYGTTIDPRAGEMPKDIEELLNIFGRGFDQASEGSP